MFGTTIGTDRPSSGAPLVLRLDPHDGPRRALAAVRIRVPARTTLRGLYAGSELLLTGVTGTVEASSPNGMLTVAPGTIAMLAAGEPVSLINDTPRDATLLAVQPQGLLAYDSLHAEQGTTLSVAA